MLCDTEESPVENVDEGDGIEQAGVLDPEVRESLKYSKHEDQFDTAHIKTGKDEVLPFIEHLYVPKNCKRKSANNGWLKVDANLILLLMYAGVTFRLNSLLARVM